MKRLTKRLIALGLEAAMGVATLAGCGGKSDGGSTADGGSSSGDSGEQVTIKFVHKYPEEKRLKYFEEVVAEFEKENPNIKIEMTCYGDEEIKDKIRVLLGSEDAPDVYFTWSGERIMQYVRSGNTMDITKYLDEDAAWKDSFNESVLGTCLKDGSYWAVPWNYSCKQVIYNKKVFEEAGITEIPKTWTEFLDVCEKIKATGKTPLAVGNQYSWVVCHFLTTLNGKMVPQETTEKNYSMEEVEYTDPGYAEALDLMKELYDKGYTNSDVNSMPWETSQAMVQEGTAGMVYEEVQNFVNYEEKLGEDWGCFDFPEIEGAKGSEGFITGGPDVFMVNSECKHPDEAIKFLKYITSKAAQEKMVYDLGFLPTVDVELDEAKCLPETIEVINKNMEAPGISEWLDCVLNQTVSDTYLEGCQTIFTGEDGASIMAKVNEIAKEVADE